MASVSSVASLLSEASALQPRLQEVRRELHRHPELGFDLPYTKALVRRELESMGLAPVDCGRSGLVVLLGGQKPGKTILLRADMDALPLQEEAEIDYCSQTPGQMHGCGHDMHTAMLLGAARLLKAHEAELQGTVKLEFQPAEEIFQGSPDMIASGVLENPHVDAAVMFHVTAGLPLPAGMVMVPKAGGTTMASCEQYHITVKGKGGHGSMPEACIDPITAAAQIHLALQEINARELKPGEYGVFTTCRFEAGRTSNVIPDSAEMWGTIRTTDPENKNGALIRQRMTEISAGIGRALRCEVKVEFYDFCPCMQVDPALAGDAMRYMTELLGSGAMDMTALTGGKAGGGSEDFAFVSHHVPTVSMFLTAGNSKEGYVYSQHNPKTRFDDSVLFHGSAAYAAMALRWLEEHV
jgi:hippurate hydrolase